MSTYERREGPYRYGALRVVGDGTVRRLQPIDYVGESPLSAGRYTYVIVHQPSFGDGVVLELEADR